MRRIVATDKYGKKKLVNVPSFDNIYINNQMGQPAYDVSISSNGSGSAATTTSNLIYDSLSAAGQTAFNAASVGNFFSVSASDYANVFAAVTGATKYAMTDSQLSEDGGDAWSGGFAFTLASAVSTIPASSYVIGFAARSDDVSAGTITPLISTSYTGTYSAVSNSPTFAAGSPSAIQYYIRRNPQTPTSVTSYLALVSTTNRRRGSTLFNSYYSASSPYTTWVAYTNAKAPVQQFMATTTKSWS